MSEWKPPTFGQTVFGHVELGDRRRTDRLVTITDQLTRHPGGSLPETMKSPRDLKAAYRLCDCADVTHEKLIAAQREAVWNRVAGDEGPVLLIHDATELDYHTIAPLTDQLGQIGKGNRRGYVCQNVLAVRPDSRQVLGLVEQILHCRDEVDEQETLAQHRERLSRESRLWVRGTEPLPAERRFVDVADQGADTFEFLEHEVRGGRRFVIRNKHSRKIAAGHDSTAATTTLRPFLRREPAWGGRTIEVTARTKQRGKPDEPARQAQLLISAAEVLTFPPHAKHGLHGDDPLPLWCVRVWEEHPPKGSTPVEWFLWTNQPIETLADASQVIDWYCARWVIEEYHKAMKTGCGIEQLQFEHASRLNVMIAVLAAVSVHLLNLRTLSRHPAAKTTPASEVVSTDYIEMLSLWRYRKAKALSIHEFYYALARLGGHQNRRYDSRPGWLVLWRGWTELQSMLTGATIYHHLQTCG